MILNTEQLLYNCTNRDVENLVDKYIDNDSEELSISAKYIIDNLSKQIYIDLINRNPNTLKLIGEEGQTEELCILAISKDPSTIKYVKNKDLYNKLKSIL